VVVDEYRELDDERILVLFNRTGRGKAVEWTLGRFGRRVRACSRSATTR
jgi:hypothetical protein